MLLEEWLGLYHQINKKHPGEFGQTKERKWDSQHFWTKVRNSVFIAKMLNKCG